ncbi:hypothetical protein PSTT_03522, partial [Puccinia striiformis]
SQTRSSLAVLSLSYALSPSGSPAVSSSQSVLSQPTGNSICMFTSKAKPSPPPIVFPEPLGKAIDYQWKPEALTKDKVKPRQKRERGERVIQQQKQMKKKVKDDETPIVINSESDDDSIEFHTKSNDSEIQVLDDNFTINIEQSSHDTNQPTQNPEEPTNNKRQSL